MCLKPVMTVCLQHTNFDGFIGVGDESNEQAENHVNEQGDEGVEVEPAEEPNHVAVVSSFQKGGVHVIPVNEGEEAFCHFAQCAELEDKK